MRLPYLIVAVLLSACAGLPKTLDPTGVDRWLTPGRAIDDIEAARNTRVLWGGVIIQANNLKDHTQLEVLAYPLDARGRPNTDAEAGERFLLVRPGYLETADYAPGRVLSATGTILELREGRVGEARYRYPVMRAEQVHLWPKYGRQKTQTHFGIGVIIH